jgi:hypothetical protein
MNTPPKGKLTPCKIVTKGATEAAFGALLYGASGYIGRYGVSFFSPSVACAVGSFATFAALGAVAAPLMLLPKLLTDLLIERSDYLNRNPHLKVFVIDTTRLLLQIAAVAAAAAILTTPIGPTIICMMVIPAIYYVLKTICDLVNNCRLAANNRVIVPAGGDDVGMIPGDGFAKAPAAQGYGVKAPAGEVDAASDDPAPASASALAI